MHTDGSTSTMSIRQLRCFLAVVDHESIAQASIATRLPASSISQAVRSLERALGVVLFHRVGRGLVLTSAGHVLVARARAVGRSVRAAQRSVSDRDMGVPSRLDIAVSDGLADSPLGGLVGQLRTNRPSASIRIVRIPADAAPADVLYEKGCELALCHLPVDVNDALEITPLGCQEFLLVAPPDLANVPEGPLLPGQIPALPIIMLPSGDRLVTEFSRLHGSIPEVAAVIDHRESHLEHVLAGVGLALLERSIAEVGRQRGAQVRAFSPPVTLEFGFVHDASLSPLARELISCGPDGPCPPGDREEL